MKNIIFHVENENITIDINQHTTKTTPSSLQNRDVGPPKTAPTPQQNCINTGGGGMFYFNV